MAHVLNTPSVKVDKKDQEDEKNTLDKKRVKANADLLTGEGLIEIFQLGRELIKETL